ncbi:hypothetical protein ACQKE0_00160 [Shewanella colwelliana]|uniref:hypothetical protein n=1 Tax=Shewanella colwelliana TaxID=23 RepID=UPI003D03F2B2
MQPNFAQLNIQKRLKLLASHPKSTWQSIKLIWANLTLPQRFYLIAIVLFFADSQLGTIAVITTIALMLEFWPLFTRLWHSLAGKAILLLFYAIVANFALVMTSSTVNEIVGVPASHFSYTHNFAILLFLPAWVIAISAIALLMAQIIVPFYIIILLILRPLGVNNWRLTDNKHYRFITMIVRFILSSIVLYHVFMLVGNVEQNVEDTFNNLAIIEQPQSNNPIDEMGQTIASKTPAVEVWAEETKSETKPKALEETNSIKSLTADEPLPDEATYARIRQTYQTQVRQLIAHFAFKLESDKRSRCHKQPGSSVVELNDYEILEIIPDKTVKYQYRFEVKKCISPAFPE